MVKRKVLGNHVSRAEFKPRAFVLCEQYPGRSFRVPEAVCDRLCLSENPIHSSCFGCDHWLNDENVYATGRMIEVEAETEVIELQRKTLGSN